MVNLFDILIHASATQKIICSFGLSLFSCIPTFIYQLIVKGMCAIVFIDAYYPCGPSSRSISEWLGETNSKTSSISRIGSKQVYSAGQNANPAFALLYLGASPSLCQECHENCTTSYEFLTQWYFSPSLFIPRSRVVTTGIPTSEPWCVKSILWATRCLVVNGNTLILSVLVIESSS